MLVFVCLLAGSGASAQSKPLVESVHSVGMTVADMDRTLTFYMKILPFEMISDVEVWGNEYDRLHGIFGLRMRVVTLRLGNELLRFTEYLVSRGRPMPPDSRANDQWFQHIAIIVTDMERSYQHLRQHKVEHASTGPQKLPAWNRNAGGIQVFYFKDPDGHFLEILQFPADKGDPRWHRKTDRLFLGIDHTAFVVRDTDASVRFYRDVLGMKVVGESENHGIEQERLSNVLGARLRVTSLRALKGPAIEPSNTFPHETAVPAVPTPRRTTLRIGRFTCDPANWPFSRRNLLTGKPVSSPRCPSHFRRSGLDFPRA